MNAILVSDIMLAKAVKLADLTPETAAMSLKIGNIQFLHEGMDPTFLVTRKFVDTAKFNINIIKDLSGITHETVMDFAKSLGYKW